MELSEKLSKAIQLDTISSKVEDQKPNVFNDYHRLVESLFPLIHAHCEKTIINEYSLIYKWSGQSTGEKTLKPIIIIAHFDVVPIELSTLDQWQYPPFSGTLADEFIWGRGALDTKVTMITSMEAVERLIEKGYVPNRDIYLAYGHDEEVSGNHGAGEIVQYLEKVGIQFEYLLDEGGCVTEDSVKEVKRPLALIGIAEKGYADIELKVSTAPGHSSTPPKHTSVGLMAQVIVNLERHQMKMSIDTVKGFFKRIGPELNGPNKFITANLWLFGGLFKRIFSKGNNGNALLRTTTAATVFEGSIKANVLPEEARAIVNFRIGPHQTVEDVVEHIKKVNKHIPLKIKVLEGNNPSRVSSDQSIGFQLIEKAINEVFGDVVIAPYLTLARTDSIKYESVVKDMYRFAPYQVSNEELSHIHGVNERISIQNIDRAVSFYEYIYMNC